MPISDFFGTNKKKSSSVVSRVIVPRSDEAIGTETEDSKELPKIPAGMWEKCGRCSKMVYADDLEKNLRVCPHCGHHFRLSARKRIEIITDESGFKEFNEFIVGCDPLGFPEYDEKLKKAEKASGLKEAVITGEAKIKSRPCVLCVMDGDFMMGSMGAAVGEKLARAAELAIEKSIPLVVFTASGGARMQEGMVSLLQMAKVSGMISKLNEAGLLYLVVLTDPTTGGVTASFAMQGDITLAEPDALVGFAGRRVIEQTIKQVLPNYFQRAEFLQDKGFVDKVVDRRDLSEMIGKILSMHERRKS